MKRFLTQHNQSRNLVTRVALVLSGLAITLGICVGTAGHASAIGSCSTIESDMAYHNTHHPDPTNWSAVNAYNREADTLDAVARSCGYTLIP
jgi:hypothetical protein